MFYLQEVHTVRAKYLVSPTYTDTFEPSNIDLAIDELREHRDFKIDELKDLFQRAYKDKVGSRVGVIGNIFSIQVGSVVVSLSVDWQ